MVPTRQPNMPYSTGDYVRASLLVEDEIISKEVWPPGSLEFPPPDLFLYGYTLKKMPTAISHAVWTKLKTNISNIIADI
jgi:hypothetical protein